MHRILTILAVLALGACTADAPDPTVTRTPVPTPEPTPSAEATREPTPAPTATPEPSVSASLTADGRFFPVENAEADALFLERDECQNRRDGYQLVFPDAWYTNTEFRDLAPCSWFSPTTYDVDDYPAIPDEIAIAIGWYADKVSWADGPIRTDAGMVAGQNAVRVEFPDEYFFVIQLGPTPEEGPNLVARTSREMGGDYELNKAVLDRLMLTIEFIGSVQ
ncbi:MAG TPA: hypothetical protein VFP30_05465 [Candidatus Limnocylindria bacterium]|nr:hypothetical protein [Candidatus Limnocylindria bacterium]